MNRRTLTLGGGALLLAGAVGIGWTRAVGSMADYEDYARRLRAAATPTIRDVIRYATLAANSHNTQPWRFRLTAGTIDIVPDFTRRTPAVDPDDHHLFVSLGCAAENLMIAAGATWRRGEIETTPGAARFHVSAGPVRPDSLFTAIGKRQSTRAEYDGRPVGLADLKALRHAAAIPGVDLVLITERRKISQVRDLVIAGRSANGRSGFQPRTKALDPVQSAQRCGVR